MVTWGPGTPAKMCTRPSASTTFSVPTRTKDFSICDRGNMRGPRLGRARCLAREGAISSSVDPPADDGDGLLIDAGGVPALNGGEVGLALLVASAPNPAVTFQEIGGGGERVGLDVEIDDAVAVAVHAIEQNVLGQKLRLADLAMHG